MQEGTEAAHAGPDGVVPAFAHFARQLSRVAKGVKAPGFAETCEQVAASAGDVSNAVAIGVDLWRASAAHRAALARILAGK